MAPRWLFAAGLLGSCSACSHFAMENDYALTGRTMDLETISNSSWTILVEPTSDATKQPFLGMILQQNGTMEEDIVFAGINSAGLTCDLNALLGTKYPDPAPDKTNIQVYLFCRWALSNFTTVEEVQEGLKSVNFVEQHGLWAKMDVHFALRDAKKQGIIVEFLEGKTEVYTDNNDKGATGFGIMTNEPPLLWQLEAVRHLQWKKTLARSAVTMPGTWYPDERFQRIHLVKSAMGAPTSYAEAFAQTVHVLNTITVPMGDQMGTDSGKGSGEGNGDHTQWGVVYDHTNPTVYWRSFANQNFQRLQLKDLSLTKGSQKKYLAMASPSLPWFADAASALEPEKGAEEISI
mmetsp:Transcript_35311/g.75242  ORF Transcript_35311/g.75242 Transcript_35311/m.75242 type:complete len:348 (+) Transcript_35311:164-1207(+)|eukprot:CAMPEP_0206488390 /NCGR_PEP_ID=MMETSP0324_2-20121206/42377_1 /ASSEMBLY_ACC=CAM_ASM_000836 /TAXON_ID=2866 /ORGANISM="Crypthecodinium cohnii, Strain Seligo" /LENGTH=347 /DNA_ID=CAMNT_0053967391 /DNA_START=108 /DNA_END=1151 /DNA_ORIENTATION=+